MSSCVSRLLVISVVINVLSIQKHCALVECVKFTLIHVRSDRVKSLYWKKAIFRCNVLHFHTYWDLRILNDFSEPDHGHRCYQSIRYCTSSCSRPPETPRQVTSRQQSSEVPGWKADEITGWKKNEVSGWKTPNAVTGDEEEASRVPR